jgi:Cu/Ag efflux protein CusF
MMHLLAVKRLIGLCGATLLMAAVCLGQAAPAKKAFTFHGKVEAVNAGAKSVTVNGEKVEGWMDAMTMGYKVDDPAVLKDIKAGDQITAIVYEGDMTFHKLQVVPKSSGESKSKK